MVRTRNLCDFTYLCWGSLNLVLSVTDRRFKGIHLLPIKDYAMPRLVWWCRVTVIKRKRAA